MKKTTLSPAVLRIFIIVLASFLFALFAVILSANNQFPENSACDGMLGAGFPVLYICDDWGGGSPTSSWGKIDFVDVMNGGMITEGFAVNFLFFTAVFLIAALMLAVVYRRGTIVRKSW